MASIPKVLRSHWWRFPANWWWRSLPLRVVLTVFLASVLVLVLGGFLLMQQATIGVIDGKKETAKNETRLRKNSAKKQKKRTGAKSSDPLAVGSGQPTSWPLPRPK